MRAADMQDTDIPAAGHHERIHLAQESVEIGRRATGEPEGVPFGMGIGHRRNPAMETDLDIIRSGVGRIMTDPLGHRILSAHHPVQVPVSGTARERHGLQ